MWGCYRHERRYGGTGFSPRAAPGQRQAAAPLPTGLGRSIAPDGGAVHRAKRGTGSEATLTAPPPAPPSSKSRGRALSARALGSDFVRFFRTSSTRQPSRTCRPRRSHTNDVNPQQPRHVHKPPAHKGLKRKRARDRRRDRSDRPPARPPSVECSHGRRPAVAAALRLNEQSGDRRGGCCSITDGAIRHPGDGPPLSSTGAVGVSCRPASTGSSFCG